jgi:caffeoyl-CoA O-methyltransferase
VISLEKFPVFAEICRRNFEQNDLQDRIDLHVGDAWELLRELRLDAPLDLAFIDGDKARYLDYFLAVEPLVRPGGLIVVDDVLFQGDVLNDTPQTEKGAGVRRFLDYAGEKLAWTRVALPFSDGIMLLVKPLR